MTAEARARAGGGFRAAWRGHVVAAALLLPWPVSGQPAENASAPEGGNVPALPAAGPASTPTTAEPPDADREDDRPPAKVRVTGMGWWRNYQLRRTLELLEPEEGLGPELDAAFLEDSVVLLQSALEGDGFLQPSGTVRLGAGGEVIGAYSWSGDEVPLIPRQLRADRAVFELRPGVRFTFREITFTGLTALEPDAARAYFVEEGFLFAGAGARQFSPAILRRGVRNLEEELVRRGYADATVEARDVERSAASGEVDVVIAVEEGRLHRVGEVIVPDTVPPEARPEVLQRAEAAGGARFSTVWQQDFVQGVRRALYRHGFAEAQAQLRPAGPPVMENGTVRHDFRLEVAAGPQVRIGEVRFVGQGDTHESVLYRATQLDPGELFDHGQVDQDRLRLGALGIFDSVRAEVEKKSPNIWNLIYHLEPGTQLTTSFLLGYGSYERLRGGIEVFHANLLNHAHRGRLQLIYSQKSASGDYLYTVPQIFGTTTDVSARIFGLEREEVSFDRREYGVSFGAGRRIRFLDADASLRYQLEAVEADVFNPDRATEAPVDSTVASLTFDLIRDRRDNPITPRRGTYLALSLETATQAIGGEVDYQRLDLQGSWHRALGRERFLHVGLRHGVVWTLGGPAAEDIPLGRRYFPGGESTIRGYTEGRASPRAADGTFIGAEVSTILNLELEQSLARNLAGVAFADVGLTAADLDDYPGDQWRVSLGLGLRYNTVVGPVRLEYGHNVVRESGDGTDAWHLSLGFPF